MSGDEVPACSEKDKTWIPKPRVVDIDGKQACINTGHNVMKLTIRRILPEITNGECRKIMTLLKSMNVFSTGGTSRVLITELLKPNSPRIFSQIFDEARAKEIDGLQKRGAFKIILRGDVPQAANIMGC